MLRKEQRTRNMVLFTMILFLLIGVGYAMISTNLSINGNLAVDKVTWDVHFENIVLDEKNTVQGTPVLSNNDTTIDYSVTLQRPGDYYSFTVDAVNEGTIDAMISGIAPEGLTPAQKEYINYSLTYADGEEVQDKDYLAVGETVTFKVEVEYEYNISNDKLLGTNTIMNLNLAVDYVQANYKRVIKSEFAKLVKDSALDDSNLDFTANVYAADIKDGFYVRSGTEDDTYPVYYYRGAITNNNAKFAGFCWKIVRTTSTGGTKLIYNGTPNASGECTNTTGTATQVTTSSFTSNTSPSYLGYMYGTVYTKTSKAASSSYLYGSSFSYSGGSYTLKDTGSSPTSTRHYTCFNNTGTCSNISYIYYKASSGTSSYSLSLSNGKDINQAIKDMVENKNNSSIKTAVDRWFSNTFMPYFTNQGKDYNDYLEDTIWCNDRTYREDASFSFSTSGFNPNGGDLTGKLFYAGAGRYFAGTPITTCPDKNDAFTVNDTVNGNGALTYPVGLITSDEASLAGLNSQVQTSNYLYTNQNWWFMTPYYVFGTNIDAQYEASSSRASNSSIGNSGGVRPMISIKPQVKIATGGDGSSAKPYEFIVG